MIADTSLAPPLNLYGGETHQPFVLAGGAEHGVGALLIHGFMGSPNDMRAVAEMLAAAGVTAHVILLPGFAAKLADLGRTTMSDWIEDAARAWSELTSRYRRTLLIGFSMGGAVALHVAARRPPDRLVLLAPLSRIPDRRAPALPLLKHVRRVYLPFRDADFRKRGTRENFLLLDPTIDLDDPALQARIRTGFQIPVSAIDQARLVARRAARVARDAIAPTLVIQGTDDPIVLRRDTRRLLRHLGGVVSYHELACDHMLVLPDRAAWPRVRSLILEQVSPLVAEVSARAAG